MLQANGNVSMLLRKKEKLQLILVMFTVLFDYEINHIRVLKMSNVRGAHKQLARSKIADHQILFFIP